MGRSPPKLLYCRALASPQALTSYLPSLIDDFFIQVRRAKRTQELLSMLTTDVDDGNQDRPFAQLTRLRRTGRHQVQAFSRGP